MLFTLKNIFSLGVKELRGLLRDNLMIILIIYTFTLAVHDTYDSAVDNLHNAAVDIVDEDNSPLSHRIVSGLLPPYFTKPVYINASQVDARMDSGQSTFVIVIPPNFQKKVMGGENPSVQLNVDATRMSQAFQGAGVIQEILSKEASQFLQRGDKSDQPSVKIVRRNRYNANLTASWNEVFMQLINDITMLAIILTGSALIRERERGTLEHLMVMPVTPFQIMTSKIWSMGTIVVLTASCSLITVMHWYLGIPIAGSVPLYILGMIMHLYAMTSTGIFLGCVANNMPQLGMLMILILMPMNMLSGGSTPMENMPKGIQYVMQIAPTTHFVRISQAILFKGAGFSVVWKPLLALFAIGTALFAFSLAQFRKSLANS